MEMTVKNLHVHLSGAEILKGVDMSAGSGRFIGLIGPNGSGKSTVLKCLYRVLKPDARAVYLNGKALDSYSIRESSKVIGVVAQNGDIGFDFNVLEMTMMGRSPHKKALERDGAEDYAAARGALQTVGMESFEDRSFATLSGGERQRVILARALAQQTPILILDELTNHLDIKYQLQLMRIIKESGRTVIAAIHDLNIAAMYCDYIYVLSDGDIYAHGEPLMVLTEALIERVYGVSAEILTDNNGIYIIYRE